MTRASTCSSVIATFFLALGRRRSRLQKNVKMPLGKVLVRLQEEKSESAGGVLLSKGAAKSDTTVGEVVAVSDGILDSKGDLAPLDIAVGDMVKFRYGSEVELEVAGAFRAVDAGDCLLKWRL